LVVGCARRGLLQSAFAFCSSARSFAEKSVEFFFAARADKREFDAARAIDEDRRWERRDRMHRRGKHRSRPTTATAVEALAIVAKALPSSRAASGVTMSKRHCG
jgi:hypothetical protein